MTELPPGTRLTVETEPRSEDIKFLEASLYEFNAHATGIFDGQLFSACSHAPQMGLPLRVPSVGLGEELVTCAISLFKKMRAVEVRAPR
jgi:hypothetical protein